MPCLKRIATLTLWSSMLVAGAGHGLGTADAGDAARDAEAMFEPIMEIDLARDARRAADEGKHLMIMFVKDGCAPCLKMKKDVLPDPAVQEYFLRHFLAYHVNTFGDLPVVDHDKAQLSEKLYARREGIWGTPTFYFLDEAGRVVHKHAGYLSKPEFLALGQFVAERRYGRPNESAAQ